MPKRRKRRRLNPAPILFLGLLASLGYGLFFSPLTALRKVRVIGALPYDEPRVQRILNRAEGLGWMHIPVAPIESDLMHLSEVKSVEFHRNLFGRGLVRMEYRNPVAKVKGTRNAVLDEDGVLFTTARATKGLIEIEPPPHALGATISFLGVWPAEKVVDLCRELEKDDRLKGWTVQVNETGRLCLNRGGYGQIVIGSADGLDAKLNVLRSLLAENPNLLSAVKELNLMDPKHPTQVPLPKEG